MPLERVRLKSFDVLKCFAIYLVIWGHCLQYLLSSHYVDEPVYRFIYSFHMPLFMMIAGFFSISSLQLSFGKLLLKKAKQLLVPSLSCGIICWLGYFLYAKYLRGVEDYSLTFSNLWSYFLGWLWFLKSLFICYLLARICIWSGKWRIIPVLLVLVISQIPLSYIFKPYNIEIMFPCFMVGIYLKRHLSWFIDNAKQLIVGFGLLFGVMILFWNASFWESVGFLAGLQSGVFDTDLLLRLIYVRSFKLLIGISASIVLILLFNQWFDQSKTGDSKLLMVAQNWGQYTMAVYVLQTFILELVMANVLNFDSMNFYLFNFVVVPILSLFLLWLCVTIAKIMGKSRVLSALMFGSGS